MKILVERIRNRELAIENDGSLEELRKVLKHCFPVIKIMPTGHCKYYFARHPQSIAYDYDTETILPTVSVKEVLAEIEGEGKESLVEKASRAGFGYDVNKLAECFKRFSQVLHTVGGSKYEPKTKVIYLNEEDKPKIEEPLGLVNWFDKYSEEDAGWHRQNYCTQNQYAEKWLEYRNNFNPNDKPIKFTNYYEQNSGKLSQTPYTANDFDIVVYAGNGFFWCTNKDGEGTVSVFKGNLNNGKVK